VSTPDPKTITIQPWEKGMIQPIEKAIQAANLGFNPQNDGTIIRIPVPPLTEERRKDIVKRVKEYAEDTKVGIRSARKSGNDIAKMLEKEGVPEDEVKRLQDDIQKLTNEFTEKAEKLAEAKENDLMKL
jgi:ribosome recycling factor